MPAPAINAPHSGFQAFILCGPGASLGMFASNPEEYPKALIPVANRPMVWYPLDWCYRTGITNITLITPPSSRAPIETALAQNPHLTSLPSPKPTILTPPSLTFTTGTSELLRLQQVQDAIVSDFILLPCDILCELPGETLLSTWLSNQASLDGTSFRAQTESWWNWQSYTSSLSGVCGERGGRRGAIGVWYEKPGKDEGVKGDVADFVGAAPLEGNRKPAIGSDVPTYGMDEDKEVTPACVRRNLNTLVYAMPMDSLKDKMDAAKGMSLRHALIKKHGRVKLLTAYRDAHIYLFPHWVKKFAARNEKFMSISEDLVGWWAKAEWQDGLSAKLGMDEIFIGGAQRAEEMQGVAERGIIPVEAEIDFAQLSSTQSGNSRGIPPSVLAEREKRASRLLSRARSFAAPLEEPQEPQDEKVNLPPVLAYLHPANSKALIRRVDNVSLLLSTNLKLAKLPALQDPKDPYNNNSSSTTTTTTTTTPNNPFAHPEKIAYPEGISGKTTITTADCLLDTNVTVSSKCVIKETVIGHNCVIGPNVRLTRCLLMDNVVVEEKCNLIGCIIGKRAKIGKKCDLRECEVQDGNVVEEGTEAKGEKFMVFEAMEEGNEGSEFEVDSGDDGEWSGNGSDSE
ncbi:Trimeric LpxA-like protein [Ascosphaera apis ARSEF 7405]|uniref:Translation initiation factor eIF2B subunit gamma n=1 Tax=Ascosphaera apis ARSEF 7405 TaxID=392613 RepID=A0A167VEY4_9EURO|nr:Trimeric LpxA-like protein [Ascosphaera apis ARSEF 7405]